MTTGLKVFERVLYPKIQPLYFISVVDYDPTTRTLYYIGVFRETVSGIHIKRDTYPNGVYANIISDVQPSGSDLSFFRAGSRLVLVPSIGSTFTNTLAVRDSNQQLSLTVSKVPRSGYLSLAEIFTDPGTPGVATFDPSTLQVVNPVSIVTEAPLMEEPHLVPIPKPDSLFPEEISFILGYTDLTVEVQQIGVTKDQKIDSIPLLRSRGSIKKGLGHSTDVVTIVLEFPDKESLLKLSSIVTQIRRSPFLPVTCNRLKAEDIDALAIIDFSASTVEACPGQMSVQITAVKFDWRQYFPDDPADSFSDLFCWPVFKYWCENQETFRPKETSAKWTGLSEDFKIFTVNPEYLKELAAFSKGQESKVFASESVIVDGELAGKLQTQINNIKSSPVIDKSSADLITKDGKRYFKFKPSSSEALQRAVPLLQELPYNLLLPYAHLDSGTEVLILSPDVSLNKLKVIFDDTRSFNPDLGNIFNQTVSAITLSYNDSVALFIKGLTSGLNGGQTLDPTHYTFYIREDSSYLTKLSDRSAKLTKIKLSGDTIAINKDHIEKIWKEWDFFGVIEQISASYSNTYAFQTASDQESPTLQYLGGSEVQFRLSGTLSNSVDATELKALWQEILETSRAANHEGLGFNFRAFVRIENNILKLLGVEHVIVNQYETSTIPEMPNDLTFSLNLIEYDPSQSKREKIENSLFIRTYRAEDTERTDDTIQRIIRQNDLNKKLALLDVYPDLGLPTYAQLNTIISDIKTGSGNTSTLIPEYNHPIYSTWKSKLSAGNRKSGFVDPDFFVISSLALTEKDRKFLTENWKTTSSDVTYTGSDGLQVALQGTEELESLDTLRLPEGDRNAPGIQGKNNQVILEYYQKLKAVQKGYLDVQASQALQGMSPSFQIDTSSSGQTVVSNGAMEGVGFIGFKSDAELTAARERSVPRPTNTVLFDRSSALILDLKNTSLKFAGNSDERVTPEKQVLRWEDLVIKYSQQAGIDPAYVLALIHSESSGNPNDVSSSGYKGLTQISGGDKEEERILQKAIGLNPKDVFDPEKNIQGGVYLLNLLLANKRSSKYKTISRNAAWLSTRHNAGASTPLTATKGTEKYNYTRRVVARYIMYRAYYLRFLIAEQKAQDPNRDSRVLADHLYELEYYWALLKSGKDPLHLNFNVKTGKEIKYISHGVFRPNQSVPKEYTNYVNTINTANSAASSVPVKSSSIVPYVHLNNPYEDHEKYDVRNRLVTAYPAYTVLLISGGRWVGMHRIFDLLYGHNGVTDIEVFQSREEPAHVASVTFSNMYRKLTNSIAETDIRNKAGERRWSLPLFGLPEQIVNLFDPRITEEMLIYRNMLLNSLNLKAGTRLHIRLGSGSDPSKWPSLFNGTIMEVPSDDYSVKVFAIGDGAELMNDMPIGSTLTYNGVPRTEITAFAGGGKDPRVTVAELFIVTSDSVVGDLVNTLSRGKYLHNNLYGIENFGRANYATPGVSIFNSVNTYGELDVNLYEANDLGENQTKALSNVLGWAWSNSDVMASISVEEGSPWKIIQVCKNISPDFIAQVMPFGLRSTLYFGRPWWDYFYDYDYDKFQQALDAERKGDVSINNLLVSAGLIQATGVPGLFGSGGATPHDAGGYKQGDYTLWTYMYRTSFFMKRKTFTQFRIISSSHNLLENNIVASTENMCNAAQVTELAEPIGSPRLDRGSSLKYFDINVFTENIKMRTEPSGVLIKGNNDARTFVNNLGQLPGIKSIDDGITNTFGGGLFNISSRANENAAVSTLVEGMKKMYDGSVLIKGDASIYPSNYICLSDYSSSMHGVFQVRSVTHTFNSDSGFTTTIVPDLAVSGTDTQSVSQWLAALRWSSGAALGYFTTPLLISAWRGLHGRLQSAKDINFTVKEEFKYLRRAGVLSPEEYSDLNRVYRQVIKDFEVVKNTSGYKEELLRRILNHQDTPVSFAQAYPKHKAVMNAIGKVANFDATVKAIYLQGSKTLKNSFVGGVLRKGATKAGQVGGALKGASPTGAEVAEKVAGKVGAVTEKTTTAVKNSAATLRTMAEEAAVATAESGLLTKITKVGYQATNIVRAVAGIILVNNISELIERKLGSRQAAIAFPLRLRGKEFSAGIEGHKGGVVGDPTDIITATLRSFVSPGDAFYDAQMSPSGGQAVGNYAKTAFASILFALGVDIKSQADRDTDEENSVITDLNNGFFKGVKQTGPFANTPTASPISSTVKYKQELRNELWSDRHTLEVMNLEKYVSPDVLSDYTEVKGGINPGELMAPNTSQYVVPNGAKQLTAPNISQYVIPDNTGRRAKIIFEAENIADRSKINYNLINDIELAAGAVGIDTVLVTSANRDHGYNTTTGNPSRHKKNQALDLGAFNGQSVGGFGTRGTPGEVNPKIKPLVDAFVAKLETMGYKRGESRNDRAALWYYNDKNRGGNHFNHVHVSRRD